MMPFYVTPSVLQKFKAGSMSVLLHALHLPKEDDRFTEICHFDSHIRIYFNDYQLGFRFRFSKRIQLKDKYDVKDFIDDRKINLLELLGAKTTHAAEENVYTVQHVTVVKASEIDVRQLGYEGEIDEFYPTRKNYPFCLYIKVKK